MLVAESVYHYCNLMAICAFGGSYVIQYEVMMPCISQLGSVTQQS